MNARQRRKARRARGMRPPITCMWCKTPNDFLSGWCQCGRFVKPVGERQLRYMAAVFTHQMAESPEGIHAEPFHRCVEFATWLLHLRLPRSERAAYKERHPYREMAKLPRFV